jgi:hypothetical protein
VPCTVSMCDNVFILGGGVIVESIYYVIYDIKCITLCSAWCGGVGS